MLQTCCVMSPVESVLTTARCSCLCSLHDRDLPVHRNCRFYIRLHPSLSSFTSVPTCPHQDLFPYLFHPRLYSSWQNMASVCHKQYVINLDLYYQFVSVKSEQTSFNSLKTIFVVAGAPQKSDNATFPWESRTILFHPHDSLATFISIPTGTPWH